MPSRLSVILSETGTHFSGIMLAPERDQMTEAFIYDHVRSPRGRGKADGSLHEVTALTLATQMLEAIRDRNKLADVAGR